MFDKTSLLGELNIRKTELNVNKKHKTAIPQIGVANEKERRGNEEKAGVGVVFEGIKGSEEDSNKTGQKVYRLKDNAKSIREIME